MRVCDTIIKRCDTTLQAEAGQSLVLLRFFILLVERILCAECAHALANLVRLGIELGCSQIHELGDLLHILGDKPAGGDCRRTDTDAAGDHRLLRIVRDRVLVDGDIDLIKTMLHLLAGDALTD